MSLVQDCVDQEAPVRRRILRRRSAIRVEATGFLDARACGVRGRAVASFKTNSLKNSMCEVIKTACGGRPNCTVRIYGQMVDVLWKNGQQEAAIRLETLWNQLANTQAFSLLCGYAMGQFYTDANFQEDLSPPHTCCSGRWGNVCCGLNHARTPVVGVRVVRAYCSHQ